MSRAAAQRCTIAGPIGPIEAVIETPAGLAAEQVTRFAVVCHPHPQHGGTMDNKVVTTLARSFHDLGLPTLRFNYRGVGASAGSFAEGIGETDDALAVLAHGRARFPSAQPWLAGFSFGGRVALRVATHATAADVARLITVAPAFTGYYETPADVPVPACPWLVVQGDADEVIDAAAVIAWVQALQPAPQLAVLAGVGHFFHGQLDALQQQVLDWVAAT
jgi:alpha/beta superfamily hydrolase